ncbi:MAG: ice-binding family protein [Candidatus Micrarchaeia archaeon]
MDNTQYRKLFGSIFVLVLLLSQAASAIQEPVDLGAASSFVIVAQTKITDANPSASLITGDVGIDPAAGSLITDVSCTRVVGNIYQNNAGYTGGYNTNTTCAVENATFTLAVQSAMATAYGNARGRTLPDNISLGAGHIGGMTLYPGLYKWSSDVDIITDVTLDCLGNTSGVYIFQIAGTLDVSNGQQVILAGGCQAKNIFWQVDTGVTLGTTSAFKGTILAGTAITVNSGASITGRAFAQSAVTLGGNAVTFPADATDSTAPAVTAVTPASDTWSASATPAFTFNYTDASSATASCTLFVAGAPMGTNALVVNSTNTAITANASLSQGSNSWYVNCSDLSGNAGSSTARVVLVDAVNPAAVINNVNEVSSGNGTSNAALSVNFSASDANIKNWTLSVYDSAWTLLQGWTETTSNLSAVKTYAATANGTYYANLSVWDNSLNANTTSFTVIVDQSAPVINTISTSLVTGNAATLTVNASDSYSGVNNCTYSGAGTGNMVLAGGLYAASLTSLSAVTAYTANVTCIDKAGNSASRTTSFTTSGFIAHLPVDLGFASNFVILAKTTVTDANPSVSNIRGDVGVDPAAGSLITGVSCTRVVGTIFENNAGYTGGYDSNVTCAVVNATYVLAARSAMETAYANASGRTLPDYTELGAGNIGGMTLAPGLYKWGTGVTIPTDVTLSGNSTGVWIFQIAGTLGISPATKVILAGGAQAKNIFWQVAGQTTLGTTSEFKGIILDQTAIVINTGAKLNGRALAQSAVTMDGNNISVMDTAVTLDSPAAGFSTTSTSIDFKFLAIDNIAATMNCSLLVDNVLKGTNPSIANNTVTTFTVSGLSTGAHVWSVTCLNAAGNIGNSSVQLFTVQANQQSSGGSSGGSQTVGAGSSTSRTQTSTYTVNVGGGKTCNVAVTRTISSSSNPSTVTTTLQNTGGSGCAIEGFAFTDTIPASFASMNEITFSPAYTSSNGRNVTFAFPSFASGASKTLVYSVGRYVDPSALAAFSVYTMANKAAVAAPTATVAVSTTPVQVPTAVAPVASPVPTVQQQQPTPVKTVSGLSNDVILGILAVVVVLGAGYYLYATRGNKKKREE